MAISFDDLVQRAEKRNRHKVKTPFVMKMPNDEPDLVVERPDAVKSMQFEETSTAIGQLRILLGKDFNRVWELFRGQDISVATMLISQMWEHWDDSDIRVVEGGKGA